MQELSKTIMARCIEDAKALLSKTNIRATDKRIVEIASSLFRANSTRSYTLFNAVLDEKVREARADPKYYEGTAETRAEVTA